ncbi:MBL fold metallo-hydrolase [Amycolatopsis sp.]|jgi:glyoxylase-like metal-dependent hydrolase (beta-lactamase superfamily II)|uniref:MBL fold metallo-hydrolase n=1 Tax=Amycolatopsis sp. TaxID=37632 RepID=UPI002DF9731F|nr:MBL fold metallo-hydrolase [Amycolatopsis sp.]
MRIGDVTVHSLPDGVLPMPPTVLYPDLPMSTWRSLPGTVDEDGLLPVPFGGFLATDGQGHRVVFDLGGGFAPQLIPGGELPAVRELLPGHLEKLGCPLDSVTDVVLSHLHIDHVGWASTNGWPTFSGARHHIHAQDWKHFVVDGADDAVRDKVSPLGDAVVLWEGDSVSVFDWLRLVHAPGHTPGASIALIESQGQSLALVGDLFHHPAALDHPDWRCGFDWDAELGASTRAEWLERLRETGTPLVGPHFPDFKPVTLR